MSVKDVIAVNLRTLRKIRGCSQPELAAQVGISPRTIARLEAAQVADPSINHVRDLARALGVTVDLLSDSELVPLTLAVPVHLKDSLEGPEAAQLLAQVIQEKARQERVARSLAEDVRGGRADT